MPWRRVSGPNGIVPLPIVPAEGTTTGPAQNVTSLEAWPILTDRYD